MNKIEYGYFRKSLNIIEHDGEKNIIHYRWLCFNSPVSPRRCCRRNATYILRYAILLLASIDGEKLRAFDTRFCYNICFSTSGISEYCRRIQIEIEYIIACRYVYATTAAPMYL